MEEAGEVTEAAGKAKEAVDDVNGVEFADGVDGVGGVDEVDGADGVNDTECSGSGCAVSATASVSEKVTSTCDRDSPFARSGSGRRRDGTFSVEP